MLLSFLTVFIVDSCEEHVIIVCGLYFLSEDGKPVKRKYWIHNVFRATEEEWEFHTVFGHLKGDRQKFFRYFRFSKLENFKVLLSTDNKKRI